MFEEEARRWEESGDLQRESSTPYGATVLRCWVASSGAKQDGVSERLQRYCETIVATLDGQDPDWYDDFLRIRDYCSICGESFRIENLSLCTHCQTSLGYCHQFIGGKAANGNIKCPSCEKGEIVG